jgi:hypothetical protein
MFKISFNKFNGKEFKGNKYQKYFYISYDTPDSYIPGNDEIKEDKKNSEDNRGVGASGLFLFPIYKEFTDEKDIILKIEFREVKIIEGKSPPSPENMKKMLEEILSRFQECLE